MHFVTFVPRMQMESHLPLLELSALRKGALPKGFDHLASEERSKVLLVWVLSKDVFV